MKFLLLILIFTSCTKTVTVEVEKKVEVPVMKLVEKPVPPIQYVRIESVDVDDSAKSSNVINLQP